MAAKDPTVIALPTRGLVLLLLFTFVINAAVLVQPVYMMQIYDRVLPSASLSTLLFISIMAAAVLVLLGVIDAIRSVIGNRIAARLDADLGSTALVAAMKGSRAALGDVQPLRDLAMVRGFVSGRQLTAFLDLPFVPFFIGILFIVHPHLFWLTLGGTALLALLTLANQYFTAGAARDAGDNQVAALLTAQAFVRSAESLGAMGMVDNAVGAWGEYEARSLAAQERLGRGNAFYAGLSRALRMGLQLVILGYGGYLVLEGQMTAGMIFAASLISGRALQPIDQIIGGWKGAVDAQRAWARLNAAVRNAGARHVATDLPPPEGRLSLDNVLVMAPDSKSGEPLIRRVSAEIAPGECVAVLGPSGAGKSTLMRAIVGALEIRSGVVRVDGADIHNWDREKLGRYFGYLSQDVELLPGTIARNIARFDPHATGENIVEAARKAQVHELIQRLPKGYDTLIGPGGMQLSGGQRQRIGLARAFYGSPKILILDEPNSNLDGEGDAALQRALESARGDGVTVVLVTQRRSLAERADKVLLMRDGALEDFGPRQEVFSRQAQILRPAPEAPSAKPPAAVVQGRFQPVSFGTFEPGRNE